ncbi:MAG TPA: FtsX-like permease family protein [Terriglobia bacterium]|nr:FtsX-like permease family protein [Terriglobia bacterium]
MTGRMILANVLHRPIRTMVSVLAVAIEVGMVLLVVGMTKGMLNQAAHRVQGVGADVMVQPSGASLFLGITAAPMPIKIGDLIKDLPHVQSVAPVLLQFNTGGTGGLNLVYGIDQETFSEVSGGFLYLSGGPLKNPWDILIDNWYARSNHLKVGYTINILGHDFHVVGIVEHGKGARLFISMKTAQELAGAENRASIFFVKCINPGYTDAVIAEIRKLLPDNKVLSVREYMSMMTSNSLPQLKDFVTAMISVAVAIGLLVIFLSMYTTIMERTRDIGILKSLGASKAYIIKVILQEAGLLCIAGVILGILGTVIIRDLLNAYYPTVPVQPTIEWYGRAAALAIVGGVVGAFYPAMRAAKLDPIDALSYE